MTTLPDALAAAGFSERFAGLWQEAARVWLDGGWAMIGIAAIALTMFGIGMRVQRKLANKGFRSVPEATWRRWIDRPEEREGKIGELLDFATGESTLKGTLADFEELRTTETVPLERDLRVMKVFVGAAPLVGLLGTVTGMLGTFGALATGSGGDKTMALVASGISEALITTETGLVIALPGLFLQYRLKRNLEAYQAFLAHLESVCTQLCFRRGRERERLRLAAQARRIARSEVARRLAHRMRSARAKPAPEAVRETRTAVLAQPGQATD